MHAMAGLLVLLLLPVTGETVGPPPRFEDYRVAASDRLPNAALKPPDIDSHPLAKRYSSILHRKAEEKPNFAGHFNVVPIHCGDSCAFLALVDRSSGRVFFPTQLGMLRWGGWYREDHGYTYKEDSRMIRACGSQKDLAHRACYYYDWTGSEAKLVMEMVP